MLGTDRDIYEKFVAINTIVKIPSFKFSVASGMVNFKWQAGLILEMPMSIYLDLAPLEIVQRIEYALEREYTVPPRHFRSDLSGFKKNPFQSQN